MKRSIVVEVDPQWLEVMVSDPWATDPYRRLAIAVLGQAYKDYAKLLRLAPARLTPQRRQQRRQALTALRQFLCHECDCFRILAGVTAEQLEHGVRLVSLRPRVALEERAYFKEGTG